MGVRSLYATVGLLAIPAALAAPIQPAGEEAALDSIPDGASLASLIRMYDHETIVRLVSSLPNDIKVELKGALNTAKEEKDEAVRSLSNPESETEVLNKIEKVDSELLARSDVMMKKEAAAEAKAAEAQAAVDKANEELKNFDAEKAGLPEGVKLMSLDELAELSDDDRASTVHNLAYAHVTRTPNSLKHCGHSFTDNIVYQLKMVFCENIPANVIAPMGAGAMYSTGSVGCKVQVMLTFFKLWKKCVDQYQ